MANGPVEGAENVDLHFSEHGVVVDVRAHSVELLHSGNSGLFVLVLGCNPERSASDELVMLLECNSAGTVSVDDVPAEEEGLGLQLEGGVHLDEEVDEVRSHEPLHLRLEVNHGRVDGGVGLEVAVVAGDGVEVLCGDNLVLEVLDSLEFGGVGLVCMSPWRAVCASVWRAVDGGLHGGSNGWQKSVQEEGVSRKWLVCGYIFQLAGSKVAYGGRCVHCVLDPVLVGFKQCRVIFQR